MRKFKLKVLCDEPGYNKIYTLVELKSFLGFKYEDEYIKIGFMSSFRYCSTFENDVNYIMRKMEDGDIKAVKRRLA